ncbi:MAG: CotH kinase family protein [Lacunisphaera sp.]
MAGHHRLELLASASDPTFLRTLLYHQVCRDYLPAPSDSLVRVVINGEDWGVYTNTEPFDAAFIREKFGSQEGAFWIAGPGANLDYLGDDPTAYRTRYRLESPENPAAWAKLIQLCKALHQAPDDDTGHVLASIIDVDSTLRFLALQNALINQDGYGSATGSYGLYVGGDGLFHLIPLGAEHSFRLVQVTEYGQPTRPRGSAPEERRGVKREAQPGEKNGGGDEKEAALLRPYLHKDYPKQSGTNLAVLLSYSLINKADGNQDDKVTAAEWHDFANSWFVIMDEDSVGRLTRDQFIAKIRLLVTPAFGHRRTHDPDLWPGRCRCADRRGFSEGH